MPEPDMPLEPIPEPDMPPEPSEPAPDAPVPDPFLPAPDMSLPEPFIPDPVMPAPLEACAITCGWAALSGWTDSSVPAAFAEAAAAIKIAICTDAVIDDFKIKSFKRSASKSADQCVIR